MRTKVQFDFYELPVESYGALRDSMLNHIDRFRAAEHQPIHTQLAIALADLAIQMDNAWPNPIETLFQRFGQTPQSWFTLLEVMKMLPEENNNYKLMTDSFKRESCSQRLQAATAQVVQFLLKLQCSDVQAKRKVLEPQPLESSPAKLVLELDTLHLPLLVQRPSPYPAELNASALDPINPKPWIS
ncbi:TNPO3 [Symbiodinium natans]|uniref:TNPO3 protein n=1 Tax=Symbiodinium natans TaxID=878477 RepID=A0A812KJJ4_9DINO|nr:TNPO3 [Symbiodinium natans]